MATVEIHKGSLATAQAKDGGTANFDATAAALCAATDCRDPHDDPNRLTATANPFGVPNHLRRLSDNILAAFNHAYAAGEAEIAHRLHSALVAAEQQATWQNPERRVGTALMQAELWVGYIEARNRYLGLAQDGDVDPQLVANAEREMRTAHRQWSER